MLKFTTRGNTVASNNSPDSQSAAKPVAKIQTLGDFFPVQQKTVSTHEYNMQRWAADRVANLLGVARDQIVIDDLVDIDAALKEHMKHYEPESIRSACNYVRRILRDAEKIGWSSANAEIQATWEKIV